MSNGTTNTHRSEPKPDRMPLPCREQTVEPRLDRAVALQRRSYDTADGTLDQRLPPDSAQRIGDATHPVLSAPAAVSSRGRGGATTLRPPRGACDGLHQDLEPVLAPGADAGGVDCFSSGEAGPSVHRAAPARVHVLDDSSAVRSTGGDREQQSAVVGEAARCDAAGGAGGAGVAACWELCGDLSDGGGQQADGACVCADLGSQNVRSEERLGRYPQWAGQEIVESSGKEEGQTAYAEAAGEEDQSAREAVASLTWWMEIEIGEVDTSSESSVKCDVEKRYSIITYGGRTFWMSRPRTRHYISADLGYLTDRFVIEFLRGLQLPYRTMTRQGMSPADTSGILGPAIASRRFLVRHGAPEPVTDGIALDTELPPSYCVPYQDFAWSDRRLRDHMPTYEVIACSSPGLGGDLRAFIRFRDHYFYYDSTDGREAFICLGQSWSFAVKKIWDLEFLETDGLKVVNLEDVEQRGVEVLFEPLDYGEDNSDEDDDDEDDWNQHDRDPDDDSDKEHGNHHPRVSEADGDDGSVASDGDSVTAEPLFCLYRISCPTPAIRKDSESHKLFVHARYRADRRFPPAESSSKIRPYIASIVQPLAPQPSGYSRPAASAIRGLPAPSLISR
ncbi:hypothetical protein FN846DRAFT_892990 [Sphaerosporella brunnea]|uniref:Uncharacterized protein n=1 Tax=Sphaerosporella brunnea TaxID=1250544 RepID=A0A5J5ENJ7_9PEZI|nr:hypothetical protein FN846DRAFT_892990 [Sphaerosporella brunnea]